MGLSNASGLADYSSGIGTQGSTLKVDASNQRVGIGTTNPQATLQVGTGVTVYGNSGIVSATAFYGDGSNLSNTGSTLSAASGVQRVVVTSQTSGTMTASATDADITFNAGNNTLFVGTANSSFLSPKAIGVGTQTTTEINAGVSTAVGSLTYNVTVNRLLIYNPFGGWTDLITPGVFIAETTFPFAPLAPQSYPIPASAGSLDIYVFGAGGSTGPGPNAAGGGGFAQMTIPVPSLSNQTLTVVVGQTGPTGQDPNGSFGGGGDMPGPTAQGGGGGGYSGVFDGPVSQGNAIIIAGGGGGGGYPGGSYGGQGGGPTGGNGTATPQDKAGLGGSQAAGGVAGFPTNGNTAGSALKGGSGSVNNSNGASGGGGYYGGGGGATTTIDGGGGGGSGYVSPNAITSSRVTPANSGGSNGPAPASAGAPSPFYSPPIGFGGAASAGGPGYVVIRSYT